MTKETIDQLFSAMLEMGTGVSDLLFVEVVKAAAIY